MTIYYLKQDTYQIEGIKLKLEEALKSWGGIKELLNGRKNILLKPNLIKPQPVEMGITTHPVFILAIAEFLIDFGYKVSVADSPALGSAEHCLKKLGIDEELKKRGIPFFSFKQKRYFQGSGGPFSYISISREIFDFDGLINLPKLKTHCQSGFTGAVKNLYGCVPGKAKALRHMICGNNLQTFMKMILKNAEIVAPILTIADGIEALHQHGPTRGEIYPLHSIFVADSCLEMDWAFCKLIGLSPESTPLFQASGKSFDSLKVLGDPLERAKDFVHAKQIPISFNPFRILRLLWQS